jgi:hypothetical protein
MGPVEGRIDSVFKPGENFIPYLKGLSGCPDQRAEIVNQLLTLVIGG